MIKILRLVVVLFGFVMTIGCTSNNQEISDTNSNLKDSTVELSKELSLGTETKKEIKLIEKAHRKDAFLSKSAIQFDINIQFRGKERLKGKITTTTNSSVCLIELSSGEKMYVNKDEVYCSEGLKDNKSVRFDAYTWAYFFLFPYKLSDPGSHWAEFGQTEMNNKTFNTQRLSFAAGTGDDPDDWYFVYSNLENNLIDYAGYIVTANKSREEAEKSPHAIQYSDYKEVDGILLAHKWTFWEWSQNNGLTESIGSAEISNLMFVEDMLSNFEIPANFTKK